MYRCSMGLLCAAVFLGGCRNPTMVEAATASVSASDLVYEITDLGSLGGAFTEARQVNALGHVAGRGTNAAGEFRAFLWDGAVMHDLGPAACCVVLLNDRDQVAWNSKASDVTVRAVFWDNGTLHDLGTLGGSFSQVTAMNNLGQIVGTSGVDSSSSFQGHAFLWQNGVMTDLGTLGGPFSGAAGINDRGQVVGTSRTDSNSSLEHAFVWQDGTISDLGSLGGRSAAFAINQQGWIVGTSAPGSEYEPYYPVLWRDGEIVNLGTLPGHPDALPYTQNDRGRVAGLSCFNLSCDKRYPFVWKAGAMTALDPDYPFPYWQNVRAMNDDGLVVGSRGLPPSGFRTRATVWDQNGAGQNLATLGGEQGSAFDIDQGGNVVGAASTASGETHAVIWRRVNSTPVVAATQ